MGNPVGAGVQGRIGQTVVIADKGHGIRRLRHLRLEGRVHGQGPVVVAGRGVPAMQDKVTLGGGHQRQVFDQRFRRRRMESRGKGFQPPGQSLGVNQTPGVRMQHRPRTQRHRQHCTGQRVHPFADRDRRQGQAGKTRFPQAQVQRKAARTAGTVQREAGVSHAACDVDAQRRPVRDIAGCRRGARREGQIAPLPRRTRQTKRQGKDRPVAGHLRQGQGNGGMTGCNRILCLWGRCGSPLSDHQRRKRGERPTHRPFAGHDAGKGGGQTFGLGRIGRGEMTVLQGAGTDRKAGHLAQVLQTHGTGATGHDQPLGRGRKDRAGRSLPAGHLGRSHRKNPTARHDFGRRQRVAVGAMVQRADQRRNLGRTSGKVQSPRRAGPVSALVFGARGEILRMAVGGTGLQRRHQGGKAVHRRLETAGVQRQRGVIPRDVEID